MLMEWEEIGCSYNTSSGVKVVLQVRCCLQLSSSILHMLNNVGSVLSGH